MEKKELFSKINEIRKEISELRASLDKIDKEKELWFNKKESLKKEIFKFVKDIKEIKHDKDDANISVRELKEQRDNHNKKVKELITKIKELNKEKIDFIKKNKIKIDPEHIKKRINELEFKIETEALSINKEKNVMKQIKELKKVYDQNIGLKEIIDKINNIDKEIKENKDKSDEIHKKIKELLNSNDPGYIKFKEYSNKINDLRKDQQNSFEKFIELKKGFLKVQEELQKKLNESYEIKKQLDELENKTRLENQSRKEMQLKEREMLVEKKLMEKKKLTKDDLIMLQK
jgi:uncharacterized coiled-coil DUF342 family protein